MKIRFQCTLLLIAGLVSAKVQAQSVSLYDINTIQRIELFFTSANWDYKLDSLKNTTDGYLKADSIQINGTTLKQVGVKYKGNSSYDSTYKKNPLTISLDKYKSQLYSDITSLKLSNCYADPSMIREVLAYVILKNYMACPRANFAQVYINGNLIGLYSNVEDITKTFCAEKFLGAKSNTFIKCNPIITPGPNVKSNLKYISTDSNDYTNFYELKSNAGMSELIALCSAATYAPQSLETLIDMDRFIWMLAYNNLWVNLDSYTGAFAQNYFIYKDNNQIFNPIIWDLNMCFGGFPFAGNLNSSMGTLSVTNMKQFPINIHENDPYWPMINAIWDNPQWKKKYIAHIKTMLNEMVESGNYLSLGSQLKSIADTAVLSDNNKFFTNAQYNSSTTTDINFGSYSVPSIGSLMSARATYLKDLTEFKAVAPTISNIYSASGPTVDSTYMTAAVANATDVYIGSRLSADKEFEKTPMFDDGKHHDGIAGDFIFGATIAYNFNTTELYIYAENADAGSFSPPRAEYEFHTIKQIAGLRDTYASKPPLTLYPNPTDQEIFIQLSQPETQLVKIMDVAGKIVYQKLGFGTINFNTSSLPSGVYFVQTNHATSKFVICR
jgi:spore coat protein CotH